QAVFAGVDKAEREYDADPAVGARRRQLVQQKAQLERLRDTADPSLLTPAVQAEVAAWQKQLAAKVVAWTPLDPVSFTSTGGATLTKQPDRSLLSGGKRPDVDTVTVVAHTDLREVTGIRLEVLTDDSLP